MAHTENTLKDLKKENIIALVLNLQNDREKFMKNSVNVWILYLTQVITYQVS